MQKMQNKAEGKGREGGQKGDKGKTNAASNEKEEEEEKTPLFVAESRRSVTASNLKPQQKKKNLSWILDSHSLRINIKSFFNSGNLWIRCCEMQIFL